MKNTYLKPETEVIDIQAGQMLASSVVGNSLYDDDADAEKEVLSTGRRGSWGNLWE